MDIHLAVHSESADSRLSLAESNRAALSVLSCLWLRALDSPPPPPPPPLPEHSESATLLLCAFWHSESSETWLLDDVTLLTYLSHVFFITCGSRFARDACAFRSFCSRASWSASARCLFRFFFRQAATPPLMTSNSGMPTARTTINAMCCVDNAPSPSSMAAPWATRFDRLLAPAAPPNNTVSVDSSHRRPPQPFGHEHVKLFTLLMQVPPWRHGDETHSSMSTLQSLPVNPARHVHL